MSVEKEAGDSSSLSPSKTKKTKKSVILQKIKIVNTITPIIKNPAKGQCLQKPKKQLR